MSANVAPSSGTRAGVATLIGLAAAVCVLEMRSDSPRLDRWGSK